MKKWTGTLSGWTDGVKDSARNMKEKVGAITESIDIRSSLHELSDKVASTSLHAATSSRAQIARLSANAVRHWHEADFSALTDPSGYRERFQRYYAASSEKIAAYYRGTFEVDKSTDEIVADIRRRLPAPVETFDEIFISCKKEAIRRAVAAFFLAPLAAELDHAGELRYANLSQSYGEFREQNNLHDAPNFAVLNNERYDAQQDWTLLDNGYNSATPLDPFSTDIEHIVPKSEVYDDFLLRLGTNDDQIIGVMNEKDNLIFADSSLNRSKGARDLLEYMDAKGTPDPNDPDIVHLSINGRDVTMSRSEAEARYEQASERMEQARIEALKTAGIAVASASAMMAAQQVVGVIVVETIDIIVDEIRDLASSGSLVNEKGLLSNLTERTDRLSARLSARFDERNVWVLAREAGIEGGVAGALAAIPQILISLFVQLPALVLAIIRECTLATVRCVRLLFSPEGQRFDGIKIVLLGTASAVMGVYMAHTISKAIAAVPLLNAFNRQVSQVLTGVVVTAVPLAAIYVFERNKAMFSFKVLPKPSPAG